LRLLAQLEKLLRAGDGISYGVLSLSRNPATANLVFNMVRTCILPLTDGELRPQLEAGDTLSFVGGEISFQTIERQVDRLGFGDLYVVSAMRGRQTAATRIQVKPFAAAA